MKPALCTITLLTTIPLLASPVFASINDDWGLERDAEFQSYDESGHTVAPRRQSNTRHTNTTQVTSRAYGQAFSMEAFYGKDLSDNEIDIGGAALRWTIYPKETHILGQALEPEAFAIFRVGGGRESWRRGSWKLSVSETIVTLGVGGALATEINQILSVLVRCEIGGACEYLDGNIKSSSSTIATDDDFDVGFLFGVGACAQLNVGENGGILISVDWIKTSCEALNKWGADKPAYAAFSVGYRWSF